MKKALIILIIGILVLQIVGAQLRNLFLEEQERSKQIRMEHSKKVDKYLELSSLLSTPVEYSKLTPQLLNSMIKELNEEIIDLSKKFVEQQNFDKDLYPKYVSRYSDTALLINSDRNSFIRLKGLFEERIGELDAISRRKNFEKELSRIKNSLIELIYYKYKEKNPTVSMLNLKISKIDSLIEGLNARIRVQENEAKQHFSFKIKQQNWYAIETASDLKDSLTRLKKDYENKIDLLKQKQPLKQKQMPLPQEITRKEQDSRKKTEEPVIAMKPKEAKQTIKKKKTTDKIVISKKDRELEYEKKVKEFAVKKSKLEDKKIKKPKKSTKIMAKPKIVQKPKTKKLKKKKTDFEKRKEKITASKELIKKQKKIKKSKSHLLK